MLSTYQVVKLSNPILKKSGSLTVVMLLHGNMVFVQVSRVPAHLSCGSMSRAESVSTDAVVLMRAQRQEAVFM